VTISYEHMKYRERMLFISTVILVFVRLCVKSPVKPHALCGLERAEVRRQSSWSEWMDASVSDEQGRREQRRMRCACRALVDEARRLRRPRLRVESRYHLINSSSASSRARHLCYNSSTT